MPPPCSAGEDLHYQTVVGATAAVGGAVPAAPAAGEGLHYQSVVGGNAVGGEAAAEGFFDLANAALVRYTVKECKQSENGKGDGASGGGGGSGGAVELLVEQDQSLHNSCGGIVWESAFCLAEYLRRHIKRRCKRPPVSNAAGLKGCRVLEVGAGCGLLGMAMAVMGAKEVVLTDHPDAMPLLRRNVQRNAAVLTRGGGGSVGAGGSGGGVVGVDDVGGGGGSGNEPTQHGDVERYATFLMRGGGNETTQHDKPTKKHKRGGELPRCMPLDWEDAEHLAAVAALGPFDVILATDVVFSARLVDPLLRCLEACSAPRTVTWVCLQERCPDAFAAGADTRPLFGLT